MAGLLAAGAAGPAMASGDGSDSSEETTPSETKPPETTPSGTMEPAPVPPSPQAQVDAARARCNDVSDRADFLAKMGGPLYKGGEIDHLRAQAFACNAKIDAALLAAATSTQPLYLPK